MKRNTISINSILQTYTDTPDTNIYTPGPEFVEVLQTSHSSIEVFPKDRFARFTLKSVLSRCNLADQCFERRGPQHSELMSSLKCG